MTKPNRNKSERFSEFWRDLDYTDIGKAPAWVEAEGRVPGIRLYCTQAASAWCLQTRGPLRLANGANGRDFIIASTSLSRDDLIALRAAIDHALEDK